MSRKNKWKVTKTKVGNTTEPNNEETFGVDDEQQRRKRKEGKGYAKTTPTDPVERDKLYNKRKNQKKASKKFRENMKMKLDEAEECKKEYKKLKAHYEKIRYAYTELTTKIDNIRRFLKDTPSTIPNSERELMLSILQYTPLILSNSPRSNETNDDEESTGEASSEEGSEDVNECRAPAASMLSMGSLSLNQQPQSLQQFGRSDPNKSSFVSPDNSIAINISSVDLQKYRQADLPGASHQIISNSTMPYANWNEQPPLLQQQYSADIDPTNSFYDGNIQQPPHQQNQINTVIYQFGDSPVEVSIDFPYSNGHELQGTIPSGASQPANNSGVASITPSYQQQHPQNWQHGITPTEFLRPPTGSAPLNSNNGPFKSNRTFLINNGTMHQQFPVQQYGTAIQADFVPSHSAAHINKGHSFTDAYEPNGNRLTIPRAPRPNSFMVAELQDRTCPENNRKVTKATRRYSTSSKETKQYTTDSAQPGKDAEKDSPYAKKPSINP